MSFSMNRKVLEALASTDIGAALSLSETCLTLRSITSLVAFDSSGRTNMHSTTTTAINIPPKKEIALIHLAYTTVQRHYGDELYRRSHVFIRALIARTPINLFQECFLGAGYIQ
jgi:hypothetical protein